MHTVPYEVDEYMTFALKSKSHELNNPLLDEVSNAVLDDDLSKSL